MLPREQIMVVDDDAGIRATLAEVLDEEGYDVVQAQDGSQALGLLAAGEPSAIILDLNMPVMDGPTFYRALRARGILVPVIILSAINAVRAARELGATAAINKPFDIDGLLATLGAVLHTNGHAPGI